MMRRTIIPIAALLALSVGLDRAAMAQDTAQCTQSQVEVAPDGVIDPCSRIVADETKSAAERGHALFIRGMGYHNTKRFALAGQDYDAAIPLTPTNEELLVSRANIAFRAGRHEEGVSYLQRTLALNPSNGHALRTIGALNDDMGAVEEASRYYTLALAADPKDAYALRLRSKIYLKQRRLDEALKDAEVLVAIAPDDINRQGYLDSNGDRLDFHIIALKDRSYIHTLLGHFDQAEQDVNSAVAYRRSAASLAARGKFLTYRPGRDKDALSDLQEAIALGSKSYDTFFSIGVIHARFRQFQEALADFDRTVEISPTDGNALGMRARMYRELDQFDLAFNDMMLAVAFSKAVLNQTVPALRTAGYWRSNAPPGELTPEFADAIRACMLDKLCK
jgi:tetratricopeptide (TPR) repeat protein